MGGVAPGRRRHSSDSWEGEQEEGARPAGAAVSMGQWVEGTWPKGAAASWSIFGNAHFSASFELQMFLSLSRHITSEKL